MSGGKRRATTELNHDNWDEEDDEPQVVGEYKMASAEVIQKRVIKTAKRRNPGSEGSKLNAFSGFSGFGKTAPSSFDFLAKLTNGSTSQNTQAGNQSSTPATQTNTEEKPGSSQSDSKPLNPVFSFGTSENKSTTTSPLTAFSNKENASTILPESKQDFGFLKSAKSSSEDVGCKIEQDSKTKLLTDDPNEMKFYEKLHGLNNCVSKWIADHVSKSPLCLLTPVFKDYETHLAEIKKLLKPSSLEIIFPSSSEKTELKESAELPKTIPNINLSETPISKSSTFAELSAPVSEASTPFSFGSKTSNSSLASGFSFVNNAPETSAPPASTSSFSFFTKTSPASETNSPLNTFESQSKPFTFGSGKPFTLSTAATAKPVEEKENEDDEDKLEPQPDVKHEENSVYDIKCKVFVKKEGTFVDKGVGMLYLKPIESGNKYQLLVRANTTVGTILLNLILSEGIPLQRSGKNNVMMVCIPTPDSKPPPVPVLVRVKTTEEADLLLETLKKYKK